MTQPKEEFGPYALSPAQAMTANFFSGDFDVSGWDVGALQPVWTGATVPLTGKAQLVPQGSIDRINWCNLVSLTAAKTVTEVTGCELYMFQFFGFKWLRFRYIKNSESTGTITPYLYVKRAFDRNR